MASILGIGNALTDILAMLPDDSLLKQLKLPKGSMQHVDMETGDKIWKTLKPLGVQLVAGGSAANTIAGAAIFGMESGFIGKVGDDDLGALFKSDQEQYGIKSILLKGEHSSGRAMVFITAPNGERTFAVYLVAGCKISLDMASYNVVESNLAFLHDIVEKYVDIVFANETEAEAFTSLPPREALDEISRYCEIAIVKVGKDGALVSPHGEEPTLVPAFLVEKPVDTTGAGDSFCSGFLTGLANGWDMVKAAQFGNGVGAHCVQALGASTGIPSMQTVLDFIAERTK